MSDPTTSKYQRLNSNKLCETTLEFRDFLKEKVIDQDRAVKCLTRAYDLSISPLKEEGPIISALFLGPSGVGKTATAEALAEYFFDDSNAFTKIPCANYTERHLLSSLIGTSAGYVGYDDVPILSQEKIDRFAEEHIEKNFIRSDREYSTAKDEIEALEYQLQLTGNKEARENIRKQIKVKKAILKRHLNKFRDQQLPISIVLFDEIEKAHRVLHNFLLEVTDKGLAHLQNGEITDFSNTFIIMTSNAGSQAIANALKNKGSIGFLGGPTEVKDYDQRVYEAANKELKNIFPPELIGRIKQNIVVYRPLGKESFEKIFQLQWTQMLNKLNKEKSFPIEIFFTAPAREFVIQEAMDHPEYGARLLKNKIAQYVKHPLASMINSHQINPGDRIYVALKAKENEPDREGEKEIVLIKENNPSFRTTIK